MSALIDKHAAKAALVLIAILIVISLSGITLPGPAQWLEAWVKLFQSVVAIVVALKIAWALPGLVSAFARRD